MRRSGGLEVLRDRRGSWDGDETGVGSLAATGAGETAGVAQAAVGTGEAAAEAAGVGTAVEDVEVGSC